MSTFMFNTPTTTSNTTTFGTQGQKPATGVGIGNTSFGIPSTSLGASTFGAASSAPATTSFNFNFGNPSTAATPTPSLLGTNLSTTNTTSSLFSTPLTSASLSTGLGFGSTTQPPSLNFGAPTSTAPSGGLNFGIAPIGATSTTTTTASSLFGPIGGSNLFNVKPAIATTTTTSSTNRGLGGLDISVSNKGLSHGSNSPTAAKENLIPNELVQTIDNFKKFVKTQKGFTSDIARGSARPLNRCAEDIASLMEILTTLAGSVQRDRTSADKLKQDTAKALQNAEIAQRTHDTPAGLQYENNAPLLFFMELSESFEQDLMLFRSQIETTEKHIHTMMTPKILTPQELSMAMSKLHESLVAVAGKLQGVHSKVQQQKEQYLNFRKYVLKDNTNVFDDIKSNVKISRNSIGTISSGPTPFGPGNQTFLSSTALNSRSNYGTSNPLVWGSSTSVSSGTNINSSSSMKPPTTSLNFNPPTNLTAPLPINESSSSFQLQKPPIGNKRGKHCERFC